LNLVGRDPFRKEQVEADFHKVDPFGGFNEMGEARGGRDGADHKGGIFPRDSPLRGGAKIAGYV